MHHYIAFLRGINLGYRRIKMDRLRTLFEAMKFADVATFIASGNVIFASRSGDGRRIEKQNQRCLRQSLGYAVDPFVRTRAEVAAVATFRPFTTADLEHPGNTVHVGFLGEALSAGQGRKFLDCRTGADEFCVKGREFYWLCRIRSNESKVWSSPQMRALRLPSSSMRNLTTIRKLAALYPVPVT
ncbi:MAG: DUF1697 domain-containing protein [Opitutaceae bacterium]|nr:DUF1697 domain-containing protein [Opitutaceae bacterium]